MSLSLADLKAQQAALLSKIKTTVESKNSNSYEDNRIWNVTFDKEKGGSAVIRFLPSPDGPTEMPYEKVIKHFFQGANGKYYTEKSLRSLDKPDPVADLNYRLYQTKIQSNMDQASAQKQRPRFYSNILVVKDPANPDNNGKTFLYEYGPAIDNLIQEKLFPNEITDPDADPVNPFNVFEAPNLLIKVLPQKLGKNIVPSYDKTMFDFKMTELKDIETVVNAGYSLKEFKDPDNFKSFEELSKKLVEVLGEVTGTGLETVVGFHAQAQPDLTPKTKQEQEQTYDTSANTSTVNEDDDDDLAALKALID